MAALKIVDKIEVPTSHGPCEIHLNFGSVTKLDMKDKIDVLVVSAFPGDYSPTPTSVIGALHRDLGISVRNLSKDKEEDLRRLFSCWWSKPISGDHSFNRILCFEGGFKRGSRPPMVVGEVFRCLVSLCKEQDIKVMMPLLAAGDQGYSQSMMLQLIVEAAIHWMQIGLPLKVLKIVVFARDLKKISEHPLIEYFDGLKRKWKEKIAKEKEQEEMPHINHDVYLSYNMQDRNLADVVRKYLLQKYEAIRIYSDHQNLNPEESWQEEIYEVMVTCARVITILTPRFLADEACLEQYNIALCCTRNMKRDYLAPFYIDSIDGMPTYMSLIQYVDCRPVNYEKILEACLHVTQWLFDHLAEIQRLDLKVAANIVLTKPKPLGKQHYDVFISYSHQNADAAKRIHRYLAILHPEWDVFIDISELKTGVAWQVKLYDSIESSSIVIALLSPPYVASKVCQEEYNLASAMHCDAAYKTFVFPILVEAIDQLPVWCRNLTPANCIDISDRALEDVLDKIDLFHRLDVKEKSTNASIENILSKWRSQHFSLDFSLLPNINIADMNAFSQTCEHFGYNKSGSVDLVLSYHSSDKALGQFLFQRLKFYLPNMTISLPMESKVRYTVIDEASLIVSLLSCDFAKNAELSEELNTALCRQRVSEKLVLFPIYLEELHPSPAYFRLLWSLFSCADSIWNGKDLLDVPVFYTAKERCLDIAARVIAYIIVNPHSVQGSFKTLLSVEELSQSTYQLRSKQKVDFNPLFFGESISNNQIGNNEKGSERSFSRGKSEIADEGIERGFSARSTESVQETSRSSEAVARSNSTTAVENDERSVGNNEKEAKKPKEATENFDEGSYVAVQPVSLETGKKEACVTEKVCVEKSVDSITEVPIKMIDQETDRSIAGNCQKNEHTNKDEKMDADQPQKMPQIPKHLKKENDNVIS